MFGINQTKISWILERPKVEYIMEMIKHQNGEGQGAELMVTKRDGAKGQSECITVTVGMDQKKDCAKLTKNNNNDDDNDGDCDEEEEKEEEDYFDHDDEKDYFQLSVSSIFMYLYLFY